MKKYYITYPLAICIPMVAAVLCAWLWLGATLPVSAMLGLCAASYGWVVSRIILHLVDKDNAPKTWQLHIYSILVSAGWTTAVFAANDLIISIALAVMVGAGIMFLGVRFDDENDNGVPDGIEGIVNRLANRR